MKKIITAGIVRVLEFDGRDEAEYYLLDLARKGIKYKVTYLEVLDDGKALLNVITAYKNPWLIDAAKKIGEEGDRNGY